MMALLLTVFYFTAAKPETSQKLKVVAGHLLNRLNAFSESRTSNTMHRETVSALYSAGLREKHSPR
jgi:hypothetical protein